MNKAIFLDKDGVLVDSSGFPYRIPTDKLMFERIVEGLKWAMGKGYLLVIISNQGWIAQGRISYDEIDRGFQSVVSQLAESGVEIADYYFCPHRTKDGCECRKPKPGMILEAAGKWNVDLTESIMVGDSGTDILAGKAAGCRTVLVRTGSGKRYEGKVEVDVVVDDVNWISQLR